MSHIVHRKLNGRQYVLAFHAPCTLEPGDRVLSAERYQEAMLKLLKEQPKGILSFRRPRRGR